MSAFKDWLNGLTSKTTPVDADELYVRDSSGTPGSKKLTWANLKATLANTFLPLTGGTMTGPIIAPGGSGSAPSYSFSSATNTGIWYDGASVNFQYAGSRRGLFNSGGFSASAFDFDGVWCATGVGYPGATGIGLASAGQISWGSAATNSGITGDITLLRDAAGTLAQRNGTNAQTARTYGTYTDTSNYRRIAIAMTTAGVASIAPEGAGTGASGNVLHISGLPTSNPGAGILWNDSGTVKVGT
jgi:hypothetical protein